MSLPKAITDLAVPMKARVGSQYDSQGQHVAYWYEPPNAPLDATGTPWRVYRYSTSGMIALLLQVRRNAKRAS